MKLTNCPSSIPMTSAFSASSLTSSSFNVEMASNRTLRQKKPITVDSYWLDVILIGILMNKLVVRCNAVLVISRVFRVFDHKTFERRDLIPSHSTHKLRAKSRNFFSNSDQHLRCSFLNLRLSRKHRSENYLKQKTRSWKSRYECLIKIITKYPKFTTRHT